MSLIIFSYLVRQFMGPLVVCLLAFNGIFVMFDLFGHLSRFIDSGLSLLLILRYYAGLVSAYSHWFIPASCMLATLYSMWRLSHHNEITAMRASGISFHKLTMPFFMVSFAMSLLSFLNAEMLVPSMSAWSDRLKDSGFKHEAYSYERNHSFINDASARQWTFAQVDTSTEEGFATSIKGVEVKHFVESAGGVNTPDWGIRADSAFYADGIWWFRNPSEIAYDSDGAELPATALAARPLPSLLPRPELEETPYDILLAVRPWDTFNVRDMHRHLKTRDKQNGEKWYDFWYHLAAPWTCIVITLFAIPAGITTGRQSVFKGVALVLGTFFIFYGFTLMLEYLGQHGVFNPFLAAWLPNFVFLAFGISLYRKLT